MARVPAYILAGGKSSRLGTDKARLPIRGKPLLLHVAEALCPAASRITVVADRAGKYSDLGFETMADPLPGLGPMGGLYGALIHRGRGWLLLSSCDLLGIDPDWIKRLLVQRRKGCCAVAFRDQIWHPLPALYHTSLAGDVLKQIERDELTLWMLLQNSCAASLTVPDGFSRIVHVNDRQTAVNLVASPSVEKT